MVFDNVERTVGRNGFVNGHLKNRHGDLLNKYLYLSGRVNMREVEMTTPTFNRRWFDIGTVAIHIKFQLHKFFKN
jgi:hypothetical protein